MNQVKQVVTKLEMSTAAAVKRLTRDVVANLVQDTPVDTGAARASWVASVGGPAVGQDTATSVAKIMATYRLRQGPVYIASGVVYMRMLNQGSSQQAPAGFVQNAIRRAKYANR